MSHLGTVISSLPETQKSQLGTAHQETFQRVLGMSYGTEGMNSVLRQVTLLEEDIQRAQEDPQRLHATHPEFIEG